MADYKKSAMKKMKGKMPPPPSKGDEGDDAMFQLPDTEEGAGDGDVDNSSHNDSPDAASDAQGMARDKDGTMATEGPSEEGSEDHEEREGPHERAQEKEHLAACSDDELLGELKRRGHPAGEHLNKSKEVDEEPAEEYSEK